MTVALRSALKDTVIALSPVAATSPATPIALSIAGVFERFELAVSAFLTVVLMVSETFFKPSTSISLPSNSSKCASNSSKSLLRPLKTASKSPVSIATLEFFNLSN